MDVDKWAAATRPLVTLLLIATLCYLVIMTVKPDSIDYKDFVNLVMIVALFWFKSRDDEKKTEQAIATIKASNNPAPEPLKPAVEVETERVS
jgi:hypothetical protein